MYRKNNFIWNERAGQRAGSFAVLEKLQDGSSECKRMTMEAAVQTGLCIYCAGQRNVIQECKNRDFSAAFTFFAPFVIIR